MVGTGVADAVGLGSGEGVVNTTGVHVGEDTKPIGSSSPLHPQKSAATTVTAANDHLAPGLIILPSPEHGGCPIKCFCSPYREAQQSTTPAMANPRRPSEAQHTEIAVAQFAGTDASQEGVGKEADVDAISVPAGKRRHRYAGAQFAPRRARATATR